MTEQEQDFYQILQELAMYHGIFSTLWRLGVPRFDDTIPTSCVQFNKEGECIDFCFNQDFWDKLDNYARAFVICHECLHVILNHGIRSYKCQPKIANVALDLAVNHMLINEFGFDRTKLMNYEKYCWVDTVFTDKIVSANKNFEYYYSLLMKDALELGGIEIIDQHFDGDGDSTIPGAPGEGDGEIEDEVKDAIGDSLSSEEIENFKDKIRDDKPGGKGHVGEPLIPGNAPHTFVSKQKTQKIWENILLSIDKKVLHNYQSQFIFTNRRMVFLNRDFLLPNEYEVEDMNVEKPSVYLYLDCSGSCHYLKDQFFDLASTIDPKKYKVRLFARTTQVHEMTKLGPRQYQSNHVGNSDDYSSIERHLQKELKNGKVKCHPIVIHMTDGYDCSGHIVKPAKPDLWIWILSTNNKTWIPKECTNIYFLSDLQKQIKKT